MKVKEMQELFLREFYEYCKFSAACNVLQAELDKGGKKIKAQTVVGKWIVEDDKFRGEYEKAKAVVERIRAENAEDFLHKIATGEQKTGKDHGISDANVKAAHMVLESIDRAKWSSKAPVEKDKKRKILVVESTIATEEEVNGNSGS